MGKRIKTSRASSRLYNQKKNLTKPKKKMREDMETMNNELTWFITLWFVLGMLLLVCCQTDNWSFWFDVIKWWNRLKKPFSIFHFLIQQKKIKIKANWSNFGIEDFAFVFFGEELNRPRSQFTIRISSQIELYCVRRKWRKS